MKKVLVALLAGACLAGSAEATTYVQYEITVAGQYDFYNFNELKPYGSSGFFRTYTLDVSSDQPTPMFSNGYLTSINAQGISFVSPSTTYPERVGARTIGTPIVMGYPDLEFSQVTSSEFSRSYLGPGQVTGYELVSGTVVGLTTTFSSSPLATPLGLTVTEVARPLPEMGTWAMMLGGFGATGGALRRTRRRTGSFA